MPAARLAARPVARLVVATLLLAAPFLHAQSNESLQPAEKTAQERPKQEPFLLTISLEASDHGKTTLKQSYTIATSANRSSGGDPSVRDSSRVQVPFGVGTDVESIETGTNIDLNDIKSIGSQLAVSLRIEINDFVIDPGGKLRPVRRTGRYSVNPVLPLGKLINVYSSTDPVSGHKIDIQIEAQPLNK
ncbi:hypothetical protein [Acidicapsa ligni]|uniref:hypothetical protein n=1 Tax=Acidicapsa ligni TaxID=542300 RepID=UPI0021E08499|nr:hypothetical protein [Acidicapsa ligni]